MHSHHSPPSHNYSPLPLSNQPIPPHNQINQTSPSQLTQESYEFGAPQNHNQPNVHLPPETLPGFSSFLETFYWKCHEISQQLLSAISLGLNLPTTDFLGKFHTTNNQLRILHYPPIPAGEIERGEAARMPAHSDWGSITLLFQDDCGVS